MAYSELIKNFDRIRDYMREFYLYGFKSRDEYAQKSGRSYDNEKRRLESWLGEYMRFRMTPEGKNVFLSIDSRAAAHDPLYRAWKAKSFTDGDITLHFILFDILARDGAALTLNQIMEEVDRYLAAAGSDKAFDSSTVRKKLNEYILDGLIVPQKQGKTLVYRRAADGPEADSTLLSFFSEVAPCGVIGSYLLDRADAEECHITFKHHYITQALDSGILYTLLCAMREKKFITMETIDRHRNKVREKEVVPLQIRRSVESGRQYLMVYTPRLRHISSYRTDNILKVVPGKACEEYDALKEDMRRIEEHLWGVSVMNGGLNRIEHIEFTICYRDDETYIPGRIEREKRCGRVERIDRNTLRFSADVYDAMEMMTWVRSFICRITEFKCSNALVEERFRDDLEEMYVMYALKEREEV